MKTQKYFRKSSYIISTLIICCISLSINAQISNDGPKNFYVETNDFQWDQFVTPGLPIPGIPALRIGTHIGIHVYADECFYKTGPTSFSPPLELTPLIWTDRRPIIDLNDDTRNDFSLLVQFWLNDPIIFNSPCEYSTFQQCFPIVGCLPEVDVDGFKSTGSVV